MAASTASMCLTRLGFCVYSFMRAIASERFMVVFLGWVSTTETVVLRNTTVSVVQDFRTFRHCQRRLRFLRHPVGDQGVGQELSDVIKGEWNDRQGIRLKIRLIKEKGYGQRFLAAGKGHGDLVAAIEAQRSTAPKTSRQSRQMNRETNCRHDGNGPGADCGDAAFQFVKYIYRGFPNDAQDQHLGNETEPGFLTESESRERWNRPDRLPQSHGKNKDHDQSPHQGDGLYLNLSSCSPSQPRGGRHPAHARGDHGGPERGGFVAAGHSGPQHRRGKRARHTDTDHQTDAEILQSQERS